jgi:hypothetical protein
VKSNRDAVLLGSSGCLAGTARRCCNDCCAPTPLRTAPRCQKITTRAHGSNPSTLLPVGDAPIRPQTDMGGGALVENASTVSLTPRHANKSAAYHHKQMV